MNPELIMLINAAIIEDGKLLVVKKKNSSYWILPGGKLNPGEKDHDCLIREVSEELSNTKIEGIELYRDFYDFTHLTPNSKKYLQSRVYFARINGELCGISSEIYDFAFEDRKKKNKLSPLTSNVIDDLVGDGYL